MTKCSAKSRVGRRKRYFYIKRLTIVHLVRVLSVNIWRVKKKVMKHERRRKIMTKIER